MNENRIVKLNANEIKIFQLLRDCVNETKLPVTLRVAGGWVRDKVTIEKEGINIFKFKISFPFSYWVLIVMTWILQLIK